MPHEILRVENLNFSYTRAGAVTQILRQLNLTVRAGDFVGIKGSSGSGKSTLFYMLGCHLKPDSGAIYLNGRDLTQLTKDELAFIRSQEIGFVFQQFHLLPRASVLDNILLPSLYPCENSSLSRQARAKIVARARELAEIVGIQHKLESSPNQLSGGEQQRVAIARALLSNADLILADEPTGNLDSANTENILELLKTLNRQGKTIVLITHDDEVARQCKTVYHLKDGAFVENATESKNAPSETPSKKPPKKNLPLRNSRIPFLTYFQMLRTVAPLAVQNLRRNKIRAMLTMIGVTVGIASVFAMMTFGQFAKNRILEGYQELGVNTIVIRGYFNDHRKATDKVDVVFRTFIWNKDILPLLKIFPQIRLVSPLLTSWGNTLNHSGLSTTNESVVWGVTPDYLTIGGRALQEGRNMTPYHIQNHNAVCVIGSEVAKRLFKEGSAVGQILFNTRSDGIAYPCRVIGVMVPHASNKDWRKPNLDVFIPFTYFESVNNSWEIEHHRFALQLAPSADVERISAGVKNVLISKYRNSGEFSIDSDTLLMAQMKKFLTLFTIMLMAIALVTLGVGGMGINNMMLVSLAERLKEIGLRKAVGATDRTIRIQFLFEACFLSGIAGLLGVIVGFSSYEIIIYGASKVVTKLAFEWLVDPSALLFSVVSVLLVGIFSGIVPAIKAERLHVIEALRSE